MASFAEEHGNMTVQEARELNEAARWYCEHDVVSDSEEVYGASD